MHHRTIASKPSIDVATAFRVFAQKPLSALALGAFDCLFNDLMERNIEIFYHLVPHFFASRNFIELFFYRCGKVIVHYLVEVFDQKVCHQHSYIAGEEFVLFCAVVFRLGAFSNSIILKCENCYHPFFAFTLFFDHIATLLNGRNRRCVGGGATNTKFFQFFYQTRLGITRRWLSEAFGGGHLA